MLFDPATLLKTAGILAATCAVIPIGKPLAALAIVLWLRYPLKVAVAVAFALAQIGEFSFILATFARDAGIFGDDAVNTLVAAAIISITLNPLLCRCANPIVAWVTGQRRRAGWTPAHESADEGSQAGESAKAGESARHRAVVVGYGPVGETVTRLLRDNEIEPTVIEINLETVRRLREAGIGVVYGDASLRATLAAARIDQAGSLILSASGVSNCEQVIRLARELNPTIHVLARSDYVHEIPGLKQAGAAAVFSGEAEVALALIEAVLRPLGATAEQIDGERDRFRREVLGKSRPIE